MFLYSLTQTLSNVRIKAFYIFNKTVKVHWSFWIKFDCTIKMTDQDTPNQLTNAINVVSGITCLNSESIQAQISFSIFLNSEFHQIKIFSVQVLSEKWRGKEIEQGRCKQTSIMTVEMESNVLIAQSNLKMCLILMLIHHYAISNWVLRLQR